MLRQGSLVTDMMVEFGKQVASKQLAKLGALISEYVKKPFDVEVDPSRVVSSQSPVSATIQFSNSGSGGSPTKPLSIPTTTTKSTSNPTTPRDLDFASATDVLLQNRKNLHDLADRFLYTINKTMLKCRRCVVAPSSTEFSRSHVRQLTMVT